MWCTRWYLPLFILPFSQASPLFLVAFLLSMTLQARPCLYCVVLLVALAQASCYWSPVPSSYIANELNISTTPSEKIKAVAVEASTLDGTVRLLDRCWCDLRFTFGRGFFDPFDIDRWEATSVKREVHLRKQEELAREAEAKAEASKATSSSSSASSTSTAVSVKPTPTDMSGAGNETQPVELQFSMGIINFTILVAKGLQSRALQLADLVGQINVRQTLEPYQNLTLSDYWEMTAFSVKSRLRDLSFTSTTAKTSSANKQLKPLPEKSFDLRPFGVDMVIDYGWGRQKF